MLEFYLYPTNVLALLVWVTAVASFNCDANDVESGVYGGLTALLLGDKGIKHLDEATLDDCIGGIPNITAITMLVFMPWTSSSTPQQEAGTLTSISPGAFSKLESQGFVNLEGLTFASNLLTTIESGAFDGFPSGIRVVSLSGNQLSHLSESAFRGLSRITTLHLQFNQLASIAEDTFSGMAELTSLNLVGNPVITYIGQGAFNIPNLVYLGMDPTLSGSQCTINELGHVVCKCAPDRY